MAFETDLEQWQAGLRRLEAAPFDERPVLEQVVREVHAELRRRLGSAFTTAELAALYDTGTGWVLGLAMAVAPDAPFAWDLRIVGRRRVRPLPARGVATTPAAGGSRSAAGGRLPTEAARCDRVSRTPSSRNRYTTQARRNPSRA